MYLPCHDRLALPNLRMTRATLKLLQGDLAAAFALNPLYLMGLAALAAFNIYAVIVLAGRLPRLRVGVRRRAQGSFCDGEPSPSSSQTGRGSFTGAFSGVTSSFFMGPMRLIGRIGPMPCQATLQRPASEQALARVLLPRDAPPARLHRAACGLINVDDGTV